MKMAPRAYSIRHFTTVPVTNCNKLECLLLKICFLPGVIFKGKTRNLPLEWSPKVAPSLVYKY